MTGDHVIGGRVVSWSPGARPVRAEGGTHHHCRCRSLLTHPAPPTQHRTSKNTAAVILNEADFGAGSELPLPSE